MNKVILVVCDGLGDRPIKELENLTPLESADTPNLDALAKKGITGLMHTIDIGVRPGSDTAHLSLFGYNPYTAYTGRGPFEVAGINMKTKPGDICFRANMATVDKDLKVKDRRAGRIKDTTPFVKLLNGTKIDRVEFLLKAGTSHRVGLIMRGKNLSSQITDSDPHKDGVKVKQVKPKDNSKKAQFTAMVLNKFLKKAHQKLKNHPLNQKREQQGKLPANYLLTRGAGEFPKLESFQKRWHLKACCIAGAGLYKGVAKILDFDILKVDGATGKKDTNLSAKIKKIKEVYKKYDFFFIHIKATDNFSHDGDFEGKKQFIKKIDKAVKPLLNLKDDLIIITADHSTPCSLKNHSADPVPLLIAGPGVRTDFVDRFGERACAKGGMHKIIGIDLLPEILNLLGKSSLFGA